MPKTRIRTGESSSSNCSCCGVCLEEKMSQEEIMRRMLAVLEVLKTLGAATKGFIEQHSNNVRVIRGLDGAKK